MMVSSSISMTGLFIVSIITTFSFFSLPVTGYINGHYYDYGSDSTCSRPPAEDSAASWLLGFPEYWNGGCCRITDQNYFFAMNYSSSPTLTTSNLVIWYPSPTCGLFYQQSYEISYNVYAPGPAITCQRALVTVRNSTSTIRDYTYVTLIQSPDIVWSSSTGGSQPPQQRSSSSSSPQQRASSASPSSSRAPSSSTSRASSSSPYLPPPSSSSIYTSAPPIPSSTGSAKSSSSSELPNYQSSILSLSSAEEMFSTNEVPFIPSSSSPFLPPPMPSSSSSTGDGGGEIIPEDGDSSSSIIPAVIGSIVGVLGLFLIIGGVIYWYKRRISRPTVYSSGEYRGYSEPLNVTADYARM